MTLQSTATGLNTVSLLERIDLLASAVRLMAQGQGTRLDKGELATRLGIHRNTLRTRTQGKGFPKSGPDGKWALADIIDWEQGRSH